MMKPRLSNDASVIDQFVQQSSPFLLILGCLPPRFRLVLEELIKRTLPSPNPESSMMLLNAVILNGDILDPLPISVSKNMISQPLRICQSEPSNTSCPCEVQAMVQSIPAFETVFCQNPFNILCVPDTKVFHGFFCPAS